jgi:SRSO17 transposase
MMMTPIVQPGIVQPDCGQPGIVQPDCGQSERWGLPLEAVEQLGNRLYDFWARYRGSFKTQTRDSSEYAYAYLSAQLRMETGRNYANIARKTGHSGQNIQHFMSNSPWKVTSVYDQVVQELISTPGLQDGGVVIVDESADVKAGVVSAGAQKQYNGRLGKVEVSQVGVFVAYANAKIAGGPFWTWVRGELFLSEGWFSDKEPMMATRRRLGIPTTLEFRTKIEIAWQLIQQAQTSGLRGEVVCCDTLYGRSQWFREQLSKGGFIYMAEVPCDTNVYLQKPTLGIPPRPSSHGRKPTRYHVLSDEKPVEVRSLVHAPETRWQRLRIRSVERGELCDEFAVRRVWTVSDDHQEAVEEWLVMRKEGAGKYSYALCNASADTSLSQLAWWKCQRYFVERSNQDAKSELGWDEFQAQKYRAWQHEVALTVLASWFIAHTKLDWAQTSARDPELAHHFEVEVLPRLSTANIRELLRAVLPLPQLTPQEATDLVIEHLINRTRSRASRLRKAATRSLPPHGSNVHGAANPPPVEAAG